MIKVLIVDDQELFRESLGIILQSSGDIDVTGSVCCVDDALQSIAENKPDVILMDIRICIRSSEIRGERLSAERMQSV